MSAPELKPCPFCGEGAQYDDNPSIGFTTLNGMCRVVCAFGHSDGMIYNGRESAAKAWNTRFANDSYADALAAENARLREALTKLVERHDELCVACYDGVGDLSADFAKADYARAALGAK